MLQSLLLMRLSSGGDIDVAAKELCMKRLIPSSGPPITGGGGEPPRVDRGGGGSGASDIEAQPNVLEALVTFLIYDSMVQRLESGEALAIVAQVGPAHAQEDGQRAAHQD